MTPTRMRPALLALPLLLTLTSACPPHRPDTTAPRPNSDRLAGEWEVNSKLLFKDGLAGVQGQLLAFSTRLKKLLDGELTLPGVPPFLARLATPFIKQFLATHVPPWAREAVGNLARLHEMIGETHVLSVDTLRHRGGHQYRGHSRWTSVTVRTGATSVTVPAHKIPGLGRVTPAPYEAEEKSGRLHIARHAIKHRFAHLFRWALEALLTAATCSTKRTPCFKSVQQVADHFLDCQKLTATLLNLAPALKTAQPLLLGACESQKKQLVSDAKKELDKLALVLTYAHLSGEADITNRGRTLTNGRWFGQLGKAYGQGRFRGTFTARFLRR